jgi:hypothetical protein
MRILRPIVFSQTLLMVAGKSEMAEGSAVGAQLVGRLRRTRAAAAFPRGHRRADFAGRDRRGVGKPRYNPATAYRAVGRFPFAIPLSQSVDLRATEERFAGTLQNIARRIAGFGIVDRTACRNDAPVTLALKDNDLFCVAEHGNIRVMGYNHDLPPLLGAPKHRDERAVNELPIQIVLRLIDDQRVAAVR